MKLASITFALALSVAALPALASGEPATQSLKAEVNGMVCSFCAQGIEKRMKTLAATQAVFVDLRNKLVAVEMKPGQVIDEKTFRTQMAEAGYDVVSVATVPQSAAQIRAANRKQ
ncbi:MAG: heavy-metal-associated domain-containing protein [Burkholderiaceae bacterium]|jgi:copper chaperone CopZ|nr:heavy-metal-associated domain-containing protein [Burkholderiaceae bacterium]